MVYLKSEYVLFQYDFVIITILVTLHQKYKYMKQLFMSRNCLFCVSLSTWNEVNIL